VPIVRQIGRASPVVKATRPRSWAGCGSRGWRHGIKRFCYGVARRACFAVLDPAFVAGSICQGRSRFAVAKPALTASATQRIKDGLQAYSDLKAITEKYMNERTFVESTKCVYPQGRTGGEGGLFPLPTTYESLDSLSSVPPPYARMISPNEWLLGKCNQTCCDMFCHNSNFGLPVELVRR
jgi:hypothetical protein